MVCRMARAFARWAFATTILLSAVAGMYPGAGLVTSAVAQTQALPPQTLPPRAPAAGADTGLRAIEASRKEQAWTDGFKIASLAGVPQQLSAECRVKEPAFVGRAPLRRLRRAIIEKRAPRVMALGSSSTVGIGASSPLAAYPVRLESDLEGFIKGVDVEMITRGVGGEIAADAAERIKLEVADLRPDLVVWQVGTNDAMAHVDETKFRDTLRTTLRWLAKAKVDVVLIDPQYVEHLATDDHYRRIVKAIDDVAREELVLLVHRFDAMAEISRQAGAQTLVSRDGMHLNDLGYRCMAEYAARAIVAGILTAEQDQGTAGVGQGK